MWALSANSTLRWEWGTPYKHCWGWTLWRGKLKFVRALEDEPSKVRSQNYTFGSSKPSATSWLTIESVDLTMIFRMVPPAVALGSSLIWHLQNIARGWGGWIAIQARENRREEMCAVRLGREARLRRRLIEWQCIIQKEKPTSPALLHHQQKRPKVKSCVSWISVVVLLDGKKSTRRNKFDLQGWDSLVLHLRLALSKAA